MMTWKSGNDVAGAVRIRKGTAMFCTRFACSSLMLLVLASYASANCKGIPDANLRQDKALLWQNGGGWEPVATLDNTLGSTKTRLIQFAYVIKDRTLLDKRKGVVVIKSGSRSSLSAKRWDANKVVLHRPRMKTSCRKAPFPGVHASVDVQNYSQYHDGNVKTPEYEVLNRFHVRFRSSHGCQWSNENSSDSLISWRNKSNRSQFSFDLDVVANGQHNSASALFEPTKAYASERIAVRRAEIQKYDAEKSGLACVKFRVKVVRGSFIRVNDLENRKLLRSDSVVWNRKL